jgi:NADH:ubiquinone oxidoreductase subunit F (NADH-binding)
MSGLLSPAPDWTAHHRVHGHLPSAPSLVQRAEEAGLLGRGGGGFPVHRKLSVAARHPGGTVICNWSEGEPAIGKDAALLRVAPHLVLDGAVLSAEAVRARRLVVAVHEGPPARRVREVLDERPDGRGFEVLEVPDRYVAGEASALVHQLKGGPALPRQHRRRLAEGRRPHLIHNAETMACLALLARGGTANTTLVTIRGAVREAGVQEVELGTPVGEVLARAGGTTDGLQAVLVGGCSGRWLGTDTALTAPLEQPGLGAGLVVALGDADCGLAATAAAMRYLADQSARQCGPCLFGLPALAEDLTSLVSTHPDRGVVDRLARRAAAVRGRGACSHPDGAAGLVDSALEVFAEDVARHLAGQSCGRPPGTALGIPE